MKIWRALLRKKKKKCTWSLVCHALPLTPLIVACNHPNAAKNNSGPL